MTSGCEPSNRLWYCDLDALSKREDGSPDFGVYDKAGPTALPLPILKLVDNFEASYSYVTNEGQEFTFLTNLAAPTYR